MSFLPINWLLKIKLSRQKSMSCACDVSYLVLGRLLLHTCETHKCPQLVLTRFWFCAPKQQQNSMQWMQIARIFFHFNSLKFFVPHKGMFLEILSNLWKLVETYFHFFIFYIDVYWSRIAVIATIFARHGYSLITKYVHIFVNKCKARPYQYEICINTHDRHCVSYWQYRRYRSLPSSINP